MDDDLRGIGAVARESGLPVSALRFYDAAGVLRPAWTDPATGYRWYSPDQVDQARLVARLRQAGLPLADIAQVLADRHRPADAIGVLERHARALEERYAEARGRLADARSLLVDPPATRVEVPASAFGRALAAVRYAVGSDPAWPALTGVLLDCADGMLRLVACDRARLAVASVPVRRRTGPPVRFVAPLAALRAVSDAGAGGPMLFVELRVDRAVLTVDGEAPVAVQPVAAEYPDYRALLRARWVRQARVPASVLVSRVVREARVADSFGAQQDVVAVLLGERGVDVVRPSSPGAVPFDRAYLLEALAALGDDHVLMELDAARQVLALAHPERPDDKNLLMPVRLRS